MKEELSVLLNITPMVPNKKLEKEKVNRTTPFAWFLMRKACKKTQFLFLLRICKS